MRTLQLRDLRTRDVDGSDELEFDGLAVPYATEITYGGISEQFARGAFDTEAAVGTPLLWAHDRAEPVGHITSAQDTPVGLMVTGRVLPTNRGRDAITLMRAGSLRGLSVGFEPTGQESTATGITYTRATLHELSLTPLPAYSDATVTATREEEPVMADDTREAAPAVDLEPITTRMDALEARIAGAATGPVNPLAGFRSLGEYAVAAYRQPELVRALVDQITANNPGVIPDGWVSGVKGIVDNGRNFVDALGAGSLPADGMNVNWPYYAGDLSAIVAEQATQKTEINSVRVDILKGTGAIKTFAAGSDVALQLIERSDPSYLDAYLRIMLAAYAVTTNTYAVTAAEAASGQSVTYDPAADGSFFTAVVEANILCYQATGRKADVVGVREASYATIAGAVGADGHPLYPYSGYGTQNRAGVAGGNREATIEIDGTPIIPVPGLTAPALATNSAAFQYLEDGPRTLSSDKVDLLGRDVAVYGYGFAAPYLPNGIVTLNQAP